MFTKKQLQRWLDKNRIYISFIISLIIFELANCFFDITYAVLRSEDFHSIIISLFGTLVGFIIMAMTILLTLSNHPFIELLKRSNIYSNIYRVFLWAIKVQFVTILLGFVAKFTSNLYVIHVELIFIILSSLLILHSIWFFEIIVKQIIIKKNKPGL